jgi:hypothetical protein
MDDSAKMFLTLGLLYVLTLPWEKLPIHWNRRKLYWREITKTFLQPPSRPPVLPPRPPH